jgi:hypothetical protein
VRSDSQYTTLLYTAEASTTPGGPAGVSTDADSSDTLPSTLNCILAEGSQPTSPRWSALKRTYVVPDPTAFNSDGDTQPHARSTCAALRLTRITLIRVLQNVQWSTTAVARVHARVRHAARVAQLVCRDEGAEGPHPRPAVGRRAAHVCKTRPRARCAVSSLNRHAEQSARSTRHRHHRQRRRRRQRRLWSTPHHHRKRLSTGLAPSGAAQPPRT